MMIAVEDLSSEIEITRSIPIAFICSEASGGSDPLFILVKSISVRVLP